MGMFRRVAYLAVIPAFGAVLGGCALTFLGGFEPRAAWRDAEERACMGDARTQLAAVSYDPQARIKGRGTCGVYAPLKVSAFDGGAARIGPSPTIGCPLASALDAWITVAVEPAALAWFGQPVVEINQLDAYSCRTVNDAWGENLSEHAFGNAIDIAGVTLADGRVITVKRDFLRGDARARGFLHEIFAAACGQFKTALGPGYPQHDDHFHLDLAHHNADGTSRYCNPTPDVVPPDRSPYASAPVAYSSAPYGGAYPGGLDAAATASIRVSRPR
jgi:hypothetical protein